LLYILFIIINEFVMILNYINSYYYLYREHYTIRIWEFKINKRKKIGDGNK
jgi:hypothetical protein